MARNHTRLTLIAPDPEFSYRPLAVAEPFGLGHAHRVPLERFADDAAPELIIDAVVEITVVTPEPEPLTLFGPEAAAAVADELRTAGVKLRAAAVARARASSSRAGWRSTASRRRPPRRRKANASRWSGPCAR